MSTEAGNFVCHIPLQRSGNCTKGSVYGHYVVPLFQEYQRCFRDLMKRMRNKPNPIRKESVKRYPTRREMDVVVFLVSKAGYSSKEWENGLEVADMDDVGMGSLLLYPKESRGQVFDFFLQ